MREQQTWTGFDVELIEELAVRGNFDYTLISMGGGSGPSVGKTNHLGQKCSELYDRFTESELHDTCTILPPHPFPHCHYRAPSLRAFTAPVGIDPLGGGGQRPHT